jgi:UPF0716 protein FxsA
MARLIVLLFVFLPLIEIAGFVQVGNAIGLWPTLAAVVIMAIAGAVVIRSQGLAALRDIQQTVGRGEVPARAIGDAMMIGTAGVLMLVPGFFTDLIGLLLLLPPVRGLIYRLLARRVHVVQTRPLRPTPPGTLDLSDDEWRPR